MAPGDRLALGRGVDRRDHRGTASVPAIAGRGVAGRARPALSDRLGGRRRRRSISTPSSPSISSRWTRTELLARGRDVLADVVGADRQLAVAAIDEDGQADRLRPPEVDQRVHRGPDRPAGVQDVVDEHDRRAVDA